MYARNSLWRVQATCQGGANLAMQYKGYTIQPFRYGVIVRDVAGFVVCQCVNNEEAINWIDNNT